MSGNSRRPLDVGYTFGWNALPARDARLSDPQPQGEPRDKTLVGADEVHAKEPLDIDKGGIGHQPRLALPDIPSQDSFKIKLGQRLKEARLRIGYSQTKLAKRMGIQQSAISQWEKGQVLPAIDNRMKLAQTLKVPLSELLETPEAAVSTDVFQDPQVQLLVHNFVQLPPHMRTTILVTVAQLLVNEHSRSV